MMYRRPLSFNYFVNLFCILLVFCLQVNLVICGELDNDSLEDALEAIERRQRDLQLREDYGQPENIGYGFQKNLGFFEPGPARHLGASREPNDWGYVSSLRDQNAYPNDIPSKRERSSFRERAAKQSDGLEYLEAVRGFWDKYQRTKPRPVDLEDLTDEEVAELLTALEEDQGNDYPPRMRRNYRIFDGYSDSPKRSPSFGQGLYGKRSSQHLNYETAPSDSFLYSLKWVNPANNREGVEALRGSEPFGDERDRDVLSILSQPRYQREESWLPEVVPPEDLEYTNGGIRRGYRQRDRKRAPVKRNAAAIKKIAADEEVKGIFGTSSKKTSTDAKKPTVDGKKANNVPKKLPEETKKPSTTVKPLVVEKKLVRREEPGRPGEISNLFRVQKKSIDWSKHFGIDKRMYANPFDTRVFNTKRESSDSIKDMEERIKNVEERILQDAIKYTGAHSDDGLQGVRDKDLQYLQAAYKLEKMSAALEDFKNSMNEAGTDGPPLATTVGRDVTIDDDDSEKTKRVAIKKEGVSSPDDVEFLNFQRSAGPSANGVVVPECPLLEQLASNCMRMEEVLGEYAELLTPACTLQQICYTCGPEFGFSRPASCDLMFLTEAQHLCQDKPECLNGASETVLALREVYERSSELGTCRANPCVAEHFLSSPSGVVTLNMP